MTGERRPSGIVWLVATWLSIAAFLAIVTILHFVRADLDPLRRGVSRYQWGEYGVYMSLAFAGLALAFGCVGRLVRQARSARPPKVAALLDVAAAGAVVVALVPVPDAPGFLINATHQMGGAVMFTASIVAMCLSPARLVGAFAAGIARATALAGSVFVLTAAFGVPITGLMQRATLSGICVWLLMASSRLVGRHLTRETAHSC